MISKILSFSALALLPMSFAAPGPARATISEATAAIDWTPVDFDGKTIYVNRAAIVESSINAGEKAARDLARRAPDSDTCDGTTVNSHPEPFAYTADCAVIREWAGTQNTYWGVWNNTPDTHALIKYGSCVFEAGTRNILTTWIGSSNIRDLTGLGIDTWQSNGIVAAQGETHCETDGWELAAVRWTIKHS